MDGVRVSTPVLERARIFVHVPRLCRSGARRTPLLGAFVLVSRERVAVRNGCRAAYVAAQAAWRRSAPRDDKCWRLPGVAKSEKSTCPRASDSQPFLASIIRSRSASVASRSSTPPGPARERRRAGWRYSPAACTCPSAGTDCSTGPSERPPRGLFESPFEV